MEDRKFLFASQEISPYVALGEISTFFEHLPAAVKSEGADIRVFMPKYGSINERKLQLHEVIRLSRINIGINGIEQPLIIKVASVPSTKVQVYFIENEDFFNRKFVNYDAFGNFFRDSDERTMFYCIGVLETVKKLSWVPDIVHVHGWMPSFIPALIKSRYKHDPIFSNSKTVFSVYNDYFPSVLGEEIARKLNKIRLTKEMKTFLQERNFENMVKLAIKSADAFTVGSKNLSNEILEFIYKTKKPILGFREAPFDNEEFINFYQKLLDD